MLAFIINTCSQIEVKKPIDRLYETLGDSVFKSTFPVILTDNGSEFKNPEALEFDNRTQEDITLMINHVNSAARASLNRNTPFKLAQILLDKSLLDKLSLQQISADDAHLKPALFRK